VSIYVTKSRFFKENPKMDPPRKFGLISLIYAYIHIYTHIGRAKCAGKAWDAKAEQIWLDIGPFRGKSTESSAVPALALASAVPASPAPKRCVLKTF